MASQAVPRTADGDAFRFRAERLSLDFCSTLLWRHRRPLEQLRTGADLARWIGDAGLRPVPAATDEQTLRVALRLREAIYAIVTSHLRDQRLRRGDIAKVNAIAAGPTAAPRITAGGRLAWTSEAPAAAALSAIARDAIDLLSGSAADRLRECAAADCAFLFLDSSRPGTRRWCAMNRCGNRQHAREHRARQSNTSTHPER